MMLVGKVNGGTDWHLDEGKYVSYVELYACLQQLVK